jgi:hypothetical protein
MEEATTAMATSLMDGKTFEECGKEGGDHHGGCVTRCNVDYRSFDGTQ